MGYLFGSYRIATAPDPNSQPAHQLQVETLREPREQRPRGAVADQSRKRNRTSHLSTSSKRAPVSPSGVTGVIPIGSSFAYRSTRMLQQSGAATNCESAVLRREVLIRLREVDDPLDDPNNGRNGCPAKNQIENALANFTEVEFVNSQTAEEQRKKRRGYPASARRRVRPHRERAVGHWLSDTAEWANLCPGINGAATRVTELDGRRSGRGHRGSATE